MDGTRRGRLRRWRYGIARGQRSRTRRRRSRGGWRSGLPIVVVGDDAANGGENLLHRRLLRLRRLAHAEFLKPIPISPGATPVESTRPQRITCTLDIDSDRSKYGRAMPERNRGPVDTHISRAVSVGKCELFSVGRAHTDPGVAHLMIVHLRVVDRYFEAQHLGR